MAGPLAALTPQMLGQMIALFTATQGGGGQPAGIAPPPNLGGPAKGLLGSNLEQMPKTPPPSSNNMGDLINLIPKDTNSVIPAEVKQDAMNLPEKTGGGFGGFLGGLDKGLQSPAQLMGLGLLGRINPNLPLAGLLAMGLLNRKK